MEYNYYSLDECRTRDKVIERLERLKDLGKIDYNIDTDDILEIDDIDLDEEETESLEDFLYENDAIPYLEREDEDEDGFDDFYDDYDDY